MGTGCKFFRHGHFGGWDRASAPRLRRTSPLEFSGIPAGSGAVVSGLRVRRMPRVYDVLLEGVSLVGNSRTQFGGIIKASSYEELVKNLKARTS